MLRNRLAAAAAAAVLASGGLAVAAATAGAQTADPTTTTTAPAAPTPATQTADGWTVTLPGVGVLTFSVDPTGAVSALVLAPATDPSAPPASTEGIQISFTSPDGVVHVFAVEVETHNGVVTVKLEDDVEGDHPDDQGGSDGNGEDQHRSGTHEGDGTSPTTESHSGEGDSHADETVRHHDEDGQQSSTTVTTEAPETHGGDSSGSGDHSGSGRD